MWPAQLHPFLTSSGADAVWQTGVRVLGYPPTWAMTGREVLAVVQALKGK